MSKRRKKRVAFGQNRHHLVPKTRMEQGCKPLPDNILWMYVERHEAWHLLFGTRTLSEVIDLLIRLEKIKTRRKR